MLQEATREVEAEKAPMRLQLEEQGLLIAQLREDANRATMCTPAEVERGDDAVDWRMQLKKAEDEKDKWRKEHDKVNGELGKVKKELRTKLTILRTLQTA